jgi:hydrogenase nickel incorporation protein HypA/HybF
MHEWALAESVITAAKKIAIKKELKEVKEIEVKIGELQQVEEDILLFAFNQLKEGIFKKTNFKIEKAKTKLICRLCGNKWTFKQQKLDEIKAESIHFVPEVAHAYIKCPSCGSPDFKIASGRGIWLEKIKGAK